MSIFYSGKCLDISYNELRNVFLYFNEKNFGIIIIIFWYLHEPFRYLKEGGEIFYKTFRYLSKGRNFFTTMWVVSMMSTVTK